MSTKRMAMIYGAIGRLDLHILKIANSWFDLHNHLYKVYKYFNMLDCYVNFCNWNSQKKLTRVFYLKAQQKAADYFSEKIQSVQCCNPQDVQVMIKGIDDY